MDKGPPLSERPKLRELATAIVFAAETKHWPPKSRRRAREAASVLIVSRRCSRSQCIHLSFRHHHSHPVTPHPPHLFYLSPHFCSCASSCRLTDRPILSHVTSRLQNQEKMAYDDLAPQSPPPQSPEAGPSSLPYGHRHVTESSSDDDAVPHTSRRLGHQDRMSSETLAPHTPQPPQSPEAGPSSSPDDSQHTADSSSIRVEHRPRNSEKDSGIVIILRASPKCVSYLRCPHAWSEKRIWSYSASGRSERSERTSRRRSASSLLLWKELASAPASLSSSHPNPNHNLKDLGAFGWFATGISI